MKLISDEQIEQIAEAVGLIATHGRVAAQPLLKFLKNLPPAQPEQAHIKANTWQKLSSKVLSFEDRHYLENELEMMIGDNAFDKIEGAVLRNLLDKTDTHPAPFKPITADDVTDEMVAELGKLQKMCPGKAFWELKRIDIANAVNAWGAKKFKPCWCETCRPITINDMRMVVCPECGNKRCPKANDHRNACTNSNEVGQAGSAWGANK